MFFATLRVPLRAPFCYLAAAAVVFAATAVAATVAGAQQTVVAAATEQNEQNDDPAAVTAPTVITHKLYLHALFMRDFPSAHSKIFPGEIFVQQIHDFLDSGNNAFRRRWCCAEFYL